MGSGEHKIWRDEYAGAHSDDASFVEEEESANEVVRRFTDTFFLKSDGLLIVEAAFVVEYFLLIRVLHC